eukprot:1981585-Rhodomonas_salina.1
MACVSRVVLRVLWMRGALGRVRCGVRVREAVGAVSDRLVAAVHASAGGVRVGFRLGFCLFRRKLSRCVPPVSRSDAAACGSRALMAGSRGRRKADRGSRALLV